MTETLTNPLLTHPVFAAAANEVAQGAIGQRLSIYASGRTKRRNADPLIELGVPLIDYLIRTLETEVVSVMATRERVGGDEFDAWFLTLRFADGLVATIDLGSFLPEAYPIDLELRLEISGTEEVIIAEPENVAVTSIGPSGITRDDANATSYHDELRRYGQHAASSSSGSALAKVILAARESAESGKVVALK